MDLQQQPIEESINVVQILHHSLEAPPCMKVLSKKSFRGPQSLSNTLSGNHLSRLCTAWFLLCCTKLQPRADSAGLSQSDRRLSSGTTLPPSLSGWTRRISASASWASTSSVSTSPRSHRQIYIIEPDRLTIIGPINNATYCCRLVNLVGNHYLTRVLF